MADTLFEEKYVSEDELLALPSDVRVEVINGAIVEMSPVGEEHHDIGGNIHDLLKAAVKQHQIGKVYMDGLIYILREGKSGLTGARVPDVSFIRYEALPPDRDRRKPIHAAQTLAVEIMSPDDRFEEVVFKLQEYLDAGSEQVWVVLPSSQQVFQFRQSDSNVHVYSSDDVMDVSDMIPGLTITIKDIFAQP
jgi:Uma2 family endonuclease